MNVGEYSYLNGLRKVLDHGEERYDRTGVGTLACFHVSMEFNLGDGFPLLSTKRMARKSILAELLWFLSGSTNARELQAQNVHIWDGNSSREFLDSRGLDYPEGEIGPGYGHQWRRFGAEYPPSEDDASSPRGVDQISDVIESLQQDPNSRRHIVCAWNPADLHKMSLPPCHVMFQFFIGKDGLQCMMYQRSADMFLGVPFNIASYALLTHMVAQQIGVPAHKLHIVIGDAHIYKNHIEQCREQLSREPKGFPTLVLAERSSIFDYKVEDVHFADYKYHPAIKAKMAV